MRFKTRVIIECTLDHDPKSSLPPTLVETKVEMIMPKFFDKDAYFDKGKPNLNYFRSCLSVLVNGVGVMIQEADKLGVYKLVDYLEHVKKDLDRTVFHVRGKSNIIRMKKR